MSIDVLKSGPTIEFSPFKLPKNLPRTKPSWSSKISRMISSFAKKLTSLFTDKKVLRIPNANDGLAEAREVLSGLGKPEDVHFQIKNQIAYLQDHPSK